MYKIAYLGFSNLFSFSIITLMVTTSALIGLDIAPHTTLATLPITIQVTVYAASIMPVNLLMATFGRRKIILYSCCLAMITIVLLTISVANKHFLSYCAASGLLGMSLAHILQFRFLAIETVEAHQKTQALTLVMLAGIGAAFLGPELAVVGLNLLKQQWLGSFLLAGVLITISTIILLLSLPKDAPASTSKPKESGQQPLDWSKHLALVVASGALGSGLMSLIMTATPITMHHQLGFGLEQTKTVIQMHIVAMFAPSLISSTVLRLISRQTMLKFGALLILCCAVISSIESQLFNFSVALILLGIGWNFLFTGSTLLLPDLITPAQKFKAQGVLDMLSASTQAVGTLFAGIFVATLGWLGLGLISGGIAMLLLIVLYIVKID